MKGPRKNGRPKKTIDPNKPKRRKRVRLQPQFCDWKNNENKVDEKGLKYKACKGEDKKRRPCGVKRKNNWVLYNRGETCTKVNRGEKWRVKNDNNTWQAYQVKKPTKTNAPKTKRPRRTKAPKPSAKPLASSTQDQDQVSGDPFAKILGRRSKSSGLGLGPIDEEELNYPLANSSLADSHIGQRKQSAIPSSLGEFEPFDLDALSTNSSLGEYEPIDLDALSTNPSNISLGEPTSKNALIDKLLPSRINSERSGDIAAQSSQFPLGDISLNALSSSNNNASSQPTSSDFAQQPSSSSDLNIDFNNLDPDVLDFMSP